MSEGEDRVTKAMARILRMLSRAASRPRGGPEGLTRGQLGCSRTAGGSAGRPTARGVALWRAVADGLATRDAGGVYRVTARGVGWLSAWSAGRAGPRDAA